MLKTSIILILVNIVVPISFIFFSRLRPVQEKLTRDEFIRFEMKYKKWQDLELPFTLLFGTGLCILWYSVFQLFVNIYFASKGGSFLVIGFSRLFLFVPSFLLGILSTVFPLEITYKLILKEDFNSFVRYSNYKSQMDGRRVLLLLSFVLVPLCLSFIILGTDYYTRFTPSAIYRNDFFGFNEIKYNYEDISSISKRLHVRDKNGKIIYRWPFYSIHFKDGFELDLDQKSISTYDFEKNYLKRIMDYSGIKKVVIKDS